MLLVISPKVLEEIVNADSGAPCSPRHSRKKIFLGEPLVFMRVFQFFKLSFLFSRQILLKKRWSLTEQAKR